MPKNGIGIESEIKRYFKSLYTQKREVSLEGLSEFNFQIHR